MTLKIPGYRILRPIAEGGMASVYLVVQESLGRRVVLKLPIKFNDVFQSARFVNEGRIIASLKHRNIITIYDIGVAGERHYFTMEYLEGGDLERRIIKGISPDEAMDLVETIGGCLEYVHRKDIIHRDIKPANILFRRDGTPVLTDFGVAKQTEADSRLTKDGTALGSPYYISPEQAECKPLDGRADIYSLGIILYEMLTGKKPYTGNSDIQIIIAHLSDPIPSLPCELGGYQDLIDRMIAKNPDDRFATAEEMVEYIKELRHPGMSAPTASRLAGSAFDVRMKADLTGASGGTRHAFKRFNALLFDESTLRFAGAMTILLAIALVFIKTMPLMAAAVDRLFTETPAAVTVPRRNPVQHPQEEAAPQYEQYLARARESMEKLHYTEPESDNAYYYYQMILKKDPGNEEALKGVEKIADIYADLVVWARDMIEYRKAEEYLNIGLKVDPQNSRLLELQKSAASK
jgi:tRNA A-37 threonylcarbamoyl transferase component Bud32/tetratricopeptide (TPR) repeat protein